MKHSIVIATCFLAVTLCSLASCANGSTRPSKQIQQATSAPLREAESTSSPQTKTSNPYLDLLEEVFDTMDQYYYQPVSRERYEQYVEKYKRSVLAKLPNQTERIDMVAYRGAGLLVNYLKTKEDTFSNFLPPKKAEEYSKKVYGYEYDIGITGTLLAESYRIDAVEKHSNSYKQGVRPGYTIIAINGIAIQDLDRESIKKYLHPPLESTTSLTLWMQGHPEPVTLDILCEKYFKETITIVPTFEPHIYCLKIEKFNRMTAEDLLDYIEQFQNEGDIKLLIIDLRNNPGGPPLAVHAISGALLPPKYNLFYYKKKNEPAFGLRVPEAPVHYHGPLAILINKGSGSASEIFAGTMKAYNRALVLGKEPTAGFAFLKSTYRLHDKSMLTLITGMSYLFDGTKLGLDGVSPTVRVPDSVDDLLAYTIDLYKRNEFSALLQNN